MNIFAQCLYELKNVFRNIFQGNKTGGIWLLIGHLASVTNLANKHLSGKVYCSQRTMPSLKNVFCIRAFKLSISPETWHCKLFIFFHLLAIGYPCWYLCIIIQHESRSNVLTTFSYTTHIQQQNCICAIWTFWNVRSQKDMRQQETFFLSLRRSRTNQYLHQRINKSHYIIENRATWMWTSVHQRCFTYSSITINSVLYIWCTTVTTKLQAWV